MEQVISLLNTRDTYFWATHAGAELDLLARAAGRRFGFEFKYADAPGVSRSMYMTPWQYLDIRVRDLYAPHRLALLQIF